MLAHFKLQGITLNYSNNVYMNLPAPKVRPIITHPTSKNKPNPKKYTKDDKENEVITEFRCDDMDIFG